MLIRRRFLPGGQDVRVSMAGEISELAPYAILQEQL